MFLAIYEDLDVFKGWDGFFKGIAVSIAAICIVFIVLLLIIFAVKTMQFVIGKFKKNTKGEEKVVNEAPAQAPVAVSQSIPFDQMDEDMMAAVLVATIDFKNETNQDARLVALRSVTDTPASVPAMDEDMTVAALVATIDFKNETNQDARLVSLKRIG